MDVQQVVAGLAGLDPAEVDEVARLALVEEVRRLLGRRALLAAAPEPTHAGPDGEEPGPDEALADLAPDAPAPDAPAHGSVRRDVRRLAPGHPSLRRRRRAVLHLVPSPA